MMYVRGLLLSALIASGMLGAIRSVAAQTADTSVSVAPPILRRASWLTDQRVFRLGDIITVVIDERMEASERSSKNARSSRSQANDLGIDDGGFLALPFSALGFASAADGTSRDLGEANRRGNLSAILSVRVVGFEPNGLLRVRGERMLKIDGREQKLTIEGVIRSDDVAPSNFVSSSRVADATVTYDGKNIGPSKGILGKILSIIWP
jgi:flagellar L-ring protein FlgH